MQFFTDVYFFLHTTTVIGVFHAYSGFLSEITESFSVRIDRTRRKHQQYIIINIGTNVNESLSIYLFCFL